MTRVRMDKWLWAARFFKTRSLAAKACELGRIECNGQSAKPAREVHVGDLLQATFRLKSWSAVRCAGRRRLRRRSTVRQRRAGSCGEG